MLKDAVLSETNLSDNERIAANDSFLSASSAFDQVGTQHSQKKMLSAIPYYIAPQNMLIYDVNGFATNLPKGQFISMKRVIKQFLETSNNFSKMQQLYSEFEGDNSNVLRHFCQGTLWKKIESRFSDKLVYPIFLYFDKVTAANCLGPHSTAT